MQRLLKGVGRESEDARRYRRFQIMREMHWNLWEYNRTPASVIEEIWAWIKTDRQMEQEAVEKAKGKRK